MSIWSARMSRSFKLDLLSIVLSTFSQNDSYHTAELIWTYFHSKQFTFITSTLYPLLQMGERIQTALTTNCGHREESRNFPSTSEWLFIIFIEFHLQYRIHKLQICVCGIVDQYFIVSILFFIKKKDSSVLLFNVYSFWNTFWLREMRCFIFFVVYWKARAKVDPGWPRVH